MLYATQRLGLPEDLDIESLKRRLRGYGRFREEPPSSQRETLFDSFDWRLFRGGLELAHGAGRLRLHVAGEAQALESPCAGAPRFVWDLAEGRMRQRLTPLLEMRALLPLAEVAYERQVWRLLDDQDKTLLRVVFEARRARRPKAHVWHALPTLVQLRPLRGYGAAMAALRRVLRAELDLHDEAASPAASVFRALDLGAGEYSSRLDVALAADARADVSAKRIHLHLLHTLEANLPGARADLDSEFLHDLRVAVRRSRSALSQIKGVFEPTTVEHFKSGLAWLGTITGPTRDLDVYLLAFAGYRDSLPPAYRDDLGPLHDFLIAHQRSEQRTLARRLASPHCHTLLRQWRSFLQEPVPAHTDLPNAMRPTGDVANERIYKLFRRVLREGRTIDPDSPSEALHELRKSCKKLRYTIECFQALYPQPDSKRLIKGLKALLDNLGQFQDLEVQAQKLREMAEQMGREGMATPGTLLAMGILVDGLLRRQREARAEFAQRFSAWAAPRVRDDYHRLFKPTREVLAAG